MNWLRTIVVVGSAGLAPSLAYAQDGSEPAGPRTVESAQTFLHEVGKQQAELLYWNQRPAPYGLWTERARVTSISPNGRCSTTFALNDAPAFRVDWSTVTYVGIDPGNRAVIGSSAFDRGKPDASGIKHMAFSLATPAGAERVRFAFEFLRANCELKSSTGF